MSNLEVMKAVQEGKMTAEEADKLLKTKKLKLKVSLKGAVQLDGLRRFPVTLYAQEWEDVLGMADDIKKFIAANRMNLTEK
jgi:hypothetical protein